MHVRAICLSLVVVLSPACGAPAPSAATLVPTVSGGSVDPRSCAERSPYSRARQASTVIASRARKVARGIPSGSALKWFDGPLTGQALAIEGVDEAATGTTVTAAGGLGRRPAIWLGLSTRVNISHAVSSG
jgi:hypothetical protein